MKKQLKLQAGKIKVNYAAISMLLILSGLGGGLLYWQEITKQKLEHLTAKFQIEKLNEKIIMTDDSKFSSFMEGHTEKYALFSAPTYYKKCLVDTNAQNIDDLDDIGDFEYIPTYQKKELEQMYEHDPTSVLVVKINTGDFSQVQCDGFVWSHKNQELYYHEKLVRFIIKNAKPMKN